MSDLTITYPPELPVSARKDDIARAIRDHQVVIIAGATGSGKTTQIPKICLELGRESIGHTQPRRIAARTIAERVAEELGSELGGLVGYQVRFTDQVSADTRIKLMTDGILLAELQRDRDLKKYDTIIIDEAHERSLTVDFLLGYLQRLLRRRPELKVIVTSATIDPESFARHFADASGEPAPIIEVSGRTFPVEVRYRPLVADAVESDDPDEDGSAGQDRDLNEAVAEAIAELGAEEPGDVLVFFSGENEIKDAEEHLRGRLPAGTEVLPLYGRLSAAEQHRVFERRGATVRRRIVLSTNVAETSLTVPGIRYVVDTGTARISRYSTRAKVQRLPIEAISQASANQRSGRSGRTSPGIAIRLYSEEDFGKRPEYTEPEILRTNLAAVILQMISLGLGEIEQFPFLTPPDSRGVRDGLGLLTELGAIDKDARITRIGRDLSRLPIDPRFGRMVVESRKHGVSREVLAIVAGLSVQDVRERPAERRGHADQLHARFTDTTSDFVTMLNLWNHLQERQRELGSSAFRREVRAEYLNYLRIREWQDVYRQLARMARSLQLEVGEPSTDADGIHKSLLAGLLGQIGLRDQGKKDYAGARGTRFVLFPGSALSKAQPAAIMSAELVETSRLFARMNAAIDPAWAEPIAGDLVKRTYSEPRWERRQGAVIADERITLFGVPIVPRRKIQFRRVDLDYSRDLFIRHALVQGEWDERYPFERSNAKLRRELEQLEERTRRRDLLYDDEAVFAFFDARIPADVATVRDFQGWWKTLPDQSILTMTMDDLVEREEIDELADEREAYPEQWRQDDQVLRLHYHFEPGADDDGVTVMVPLALLPGLRAEGFDWQVPGLREELVTALIKTLPKGIRRNVVPAGDWARRLLAEHVPAEPDGRELVQVLATAIRAAAHTPVEPGDFDVERLPAHLRVTFRAVDQRGRAVRNEKDLAALQAALAERSRSSVAKVAAAAPKNDLERSGIERWDLDALPQVLDTKQPGGVVRAYPSLEDDGRSVSIRLQSTPEAQQRAHRRGVLRLLQLATPSPAGYVLEHLTSKEKLLLAAGPYPSARALIDDALAASIRFLVDERMQGALPWDRAAFDTLREQVSQGVLPTLDATIEVVLRVLGEAQAAEKALKGGTSLALLPALNDARAQLAGLVHPGFVSAIGASQLREVPRYLRGLQQRLQRLAENPGRDRVGQNEVESATRLFTEAGGTVPVPADAPGRLVRTRWLLEELRVSVFAQTLGTAEPASLKRVRQALDGR
ncbi:ATP-dependent RNA helicase HrpA [Arenivirga flava]|uniref:ATP-dependent helicase n=1 Tax=Arenivirga flava TaxID=1930060 RepID=A0AA37UGI9_9MICO|nr:ATP-dependent RNA helicase HrpA [Arenivirga flava]GMA28373.1 ATP-dependent helicase [Arenivirga flava]